jgi:hypothetical protein
MKNIPLLRDRLQVLESMGLAMDAFLDPNSTVASTAIAAAGQSNPWFTEAEIRRAVSAIRPWLRTPVLMQWLSDEKISDEPLLPKNVGIIMAGNIPMVNFLDALAVWLSGHKAIIKLSSSDPALLPWFVQQAGMPDSMVEFSGQKLSGFDAVIATGSANSNRYFEYYFRHVPHILRSSRSSAAILTGKESQAELIALGSDVFAYYGLGCRSVSHLLLPNNFNFEPLMKCWETEFEYISHHHRYMNNYDYQKAVMLVAAKPFLDAGFFMLTESENLASPVSVVHYSYALSPEIPEAWLQSNALQCCVGTKQLPLGQSQGPGLQDYPDNVNLMNFLLNLQPNSKRLPYL